MNPGPEADRVLLAHMHDCLERILEYTNAERACFDASRLVQDAVIRNLQTLAESSQRLSSEIKVTELQIPWRELAGFRNVIVHGAYFSPSWTPFQADRGRHFSVIVDGVSV